MSFSRITIIVKPSLRLSSRRLLSTPAGPLNDEKLAKYADKARRHVEFKQAKGNYLKLNNISLAEIMILAIIFIFLVLLLPFITIFICVIFSASSNLCRRC